MTVFVTNMNNRYPLELTLRSLARRTSYPSYRIVVCDNASTDGSLEVLKSLKDELPLEVIAAPYPRKQSAWYDEFFQTADTPYWFAVHEDMIFFGSDWIADMVRVMEADPRLYILQGDIFPATESYVEPVNHSVISLEESLTTWLYCVRTSLRDHIDTSFAFFPGDIDPQTKLQRCWDLGGKLLQDMRAKGLAYASMPPLFRSKWHHIGNLSYAFLVGDDPAYIALKRYQIEDTKRMLRRYYPKAKEVAR